MLSTWIWSAFYCLAVGLKSLQKEHFFLSFVTRNALDFWKADLRRENLDKQFREQNFRSQGRRTRLLQNQVSYFAKTIGHVLSLCISKIWKFLIGLLSNTLYISSLAGNTAFFHNCIRHTSFSTCCICIFLNFVNKSSKSWNFSIQITSLWFLRFDDCSKPFPQHYPNASFQNLLIT